MLLGFANSIFQASDKSVSGHSNWTQAASFGTVPALDQPRNHFDMNQFRQDLDHMVALGVNSYRFSIEWSQIQPQSGKGYFNEAIIGQYGKMINECLIRGIQPMMTLFHFNEPRWFTNRGGFEAEENIADFILFCTEMFKRFQDRVKLWCTINEPSIHAFSGYLYGQFPPHEHSLQKTVTVLKNLLKAHTEAYQAIKKMEGGESAQIGIVHNPLHFVPRYRWEPIECILSKFLTHITDHLVMQYLSSGEYHYHFPMIASEKYVNTYAQPYDFIGLNYYADAVLGFNRKNIFGPTCFPHQEMGDMYLPIDPTGFSQAIDHMAALGKPIYITETGIADAEDKLRGKFLEQYFTVVKDKVKQGVDIRGVYHWTFADNYEWNEGYTKKFGLFDVNRTRRASATTFEKFIKEIRDDDANANRDTYVSSGKLSV